jgi:hypothetical protein
MRPPRRRPEVAGKRLKRLLLHFPTDSQIRYLEDVPERGDRVSGLRGEPYVVTDVTRDGAGFVVVCTRAVEVRETPRETST